MHSGAVTIPTQTDVVSSQSSALLSDHRLTTNYDRLTSDSQLRPSSEPCVMADNLCVESSVVQQSASVDWSCVDVSAANMKSCNDADSDVRALSSCLQHVGDVPRQSVLTVNDSRVSDVGSAVTADERCRLQAGLVVSGSVWRKVEPRHCRHVVVTVKESPAVSLPPLQDTNDGDRSVHSDTVATRCSVDDSSHSETGYELTDNNAVTTHQLRDDITDGDLIDYSDDGTESLTDSAREQVHVFIALFDYDPATMSPNPDAVESELPFTEGDLIKVGCCIRHW